MKLPTDDPIVVVAMGRTPMAGFQGEFAPMTCSDLGAKAIHAVVKQAELKEEEVDEVLMGCVLPAGQGQAPARQAAIKAGLPKSVPCTTVNKMCGSGMKTTMQMVESLLAGTVTVGVAGGMESMTNAPYILPKMREGARLGHAEAKDHMFLDGLEDAYEGGLMGSFAELCAEKYQFTREAQDEYAIASLNRAVSAHESGQFANEIIPVTVETRKGSYTIEQDEQPAKARPEKIPNLKPAFKKDGTVTAANASSISDGAAAIVLMRQSEAARRGLKPIAKVLAQSSHAQEPAWFTTAPVQAIDDVMKDLEWGVGDVDLFEVNEAFAVVPMAAMQELSIPHEKINVNGGACALGHPIGASGARIIVTLLNALQKRGLKTGVASLCIGGGEATAMAFELAA
ncbi:acetyl-CoA C-acyltransferase [Parvularcula sp. IMCC14364]|uniref:acetyl-CoA C-acyltransferase n=1 Tax=Parvularcula sp. IMCC14364 TaxID=3067902 RepID=UPI0027409629|nr:acetyl-CoA C-acyltransferase [Parvularcula sp. IMCC14364]